MHLKKSEPQITQESSVISSAFHLASTAVAPPSPRLDVEIHNTGNDHHQSLLFLPPTPHKRPVMHSHQNSSAALIKRSQTITSISSTTSPPAIQTRLPVSIRHLLCRLRLRLRLLLLISFPTVYLVISTTAGSRRASPLEIFSALVLTSAVFVLLSLSISLLPIPSIRLLLSRSSALLLSRHLPGRRRHRSPPPPVLWSIGSPSNCSDFTLKPAFGFWVQVYSNGDVYEGEVHKGKCSGSGVYYYYLSGRYEGDWVDDKYDGYGVETWARGSRYRGQYSKGLRHGYGVYRFYTGDVYAGEWSNGQSHGVGVHTCDDGSRYIGEFKWGVKHGIGHYHFRNGDVYAGEYFADKMHGFGIYRFANGHRYEGAWHEGTRQGLGMYTFRNGESQSGHWQSGVLDTLSTQNYVPGSPVAVNHSKVLNSVQEARRAAEKAYDVARVDDRVNKVVAAANKAANSARVAAVKAVQKQIPSQGEVSSTSIV